MVKHRIWWRNGHIINTHLIWNPVLLFCTKTLLQELLQCQVWLNKLCAKLTAICSVLTTETQMCCHVVSLVACHGPLYKSVLTFLMEWIVYSVQLTLVTQALHTTLPSHYNRYNGSTFKVSETTTYSVLRSQMTIHWLLNAEQKNLYSALSNHRLTLV